MPLDKLNDSSQVQAYSRDGTLRTLDRDELSGKRSQFNEQIVAERTPLIELNSSLGLSVLRDVQTTAGTGTITSGASGGGEHNLSTGSTAGGSAELVSTERGRYYPGTSAQIGMGIRLSTGTFSGTANAEWGYDDEAEGVGFGVDSTGVYIYYTRNSSQTKVYQSSWNVDKMDGTGFSGNTLDVTNGNIYQIELTWYGYGEIEWGVVAQDSSGFQREYVVHRYAPTSSNSLRNPNLPIRADITNGNQNTDYDMYVGGRQYSVLGRYIPSFRQTHDYRLALSGVGTTFVPTVSFRRKSSNRGVPITLHQIDLLVSGDALFQVRVNGTLTGASWGTPSDLSATETVLESDKSATAISGGEVIEQGLVASGAGSRSGGSSNTAYKIVLPNEDEITLCVRALSGTISVSAVLGIQEEW